MIGRESKPFFVQNNCKTVHAVSLGLHNTNLLGIVQDLEPFSTIGEWLKMTPPLAPFINNSDPLPPINKPISLSPSTSIIKLHLQFDTRLQADYHRQTDTDTDRFILERQEI